MDRFFIGGIGGLLFSIIIGKFYIPIITKREVNQSIRLDGPESHLDKEGTPTMGGVIFILSTILAVLVFKELSTKNTIVLLSMVGFGLVGLVDDGLIILYNRNEGLTPRQKILAQILVSLGVIYLSYNDPDLKNIIIPFTHMGAINLGIFYLPFVLFVLLGTVNSVNLTDGLDGLASVVSIIVLFGFGILSVLTHNIDVAIFCITLVGALIGFLVYNKFPAKIFMGDVGSLALGGGIGAIALVTGTELYLPIIGFIYVVETLSVIIQVYYFKRYKKRVFLMSPLHHHYEEKGWHETKVVRVFSMVSILTTVLGIIAII